MKKNDMLQTTNNTKDKLIETGIKLFSKYGYDGTTTRMIAKDSGFNISLVSFYFGNKQNFYRAVLEHVANAADIYFDEFYKEFLYEKENGNINRNKAWDLIEKLVYAQLYVGINKPKPEYVSLLYWEQINPPEGCSPITEKVNVRTEESLAYLLTCYESTIDYRKATLISRFINGGIITFSEHPGFIENITSRIRMHPTDDFIKHTLKQFIMSSIEHFTLF